MTATSHVTSPPLGPLTAALIARLAFDTYRAHARSVIGVAIVVFLPVTILTQLLEHWTEAHDGRVPDVPGALILFVAAVEVAGAVIGSAFFAGLLDKIVGAHHYGHHKVPLSEVVRTLPYGRLVAVDILRTVIVGLGLLLLVVPGIVAFTFLSLSGPMVNIEGHGVLSAMRRSVWLVRRHFWLVLRTVTLLVAAEVLLEDAVSALFHGADLGLLPTAVEVAISATFGAIVSLFEVTLAYELSLRHPLILTRPDDARKLGTR